MGDLAWPVLQTHLTGVVTVSEEEIVAAMRLVSDCRTKFVVGLISLVSRLSPCASDRKLSSAWERG